MRKRHFAKLSDLACDSRPLKAIRLAVGKVTSRAGKEDFRPRLTDVGNRERYPDSKLDFFIVEDERVVGVKSSDMISRRRHLRGRDKVWAVPEIYSV